MHKYHCVGINMVIWSNGETLNNLQAFMMDRGVCNGGLGRRPQKVIRGDVE